MLGSLLNMEILMSHVETIITFVLGALITWIAAHFYKRAGDELRTEAARLRSLTELVLYAQLNRDAKIEPRLDADGRVVGLVVSAVGRA